MSGIALLEKNGEGCVALRGVRVSSQLAGMSNKTLIEQTFVNNEPKEIEAVYTFPLPSDAAVCHFEVVTGDRVLTGKVEEADDATDQYEAAVGRGDAAFQMEQVRPDVFTIHVGNLKPAQAVTIRITYIEPLEMVDGRIRLAFPTTLAPRYATDTGMDPLDAQIDADALNPPHAETVPYGLSFSLSASLGAPLLDVVSPTHELSVESAGTRTDIRLSAELTEMNRDIVIDMRPEPTVQPSAVVTKGPDGAGYVAVTWYPEFDVAPAEDREPGETIFLVDCSGSMMGESMAHVRNAMQHCLRGIPEGDCFNIWRFGSTFESMVPESVTCTANWRRLALQYIEQLDDCLGGTELHAPLEAILKSTPSVPGIRQIVLLTDGEVSNEPAVVALAKKHADRNRIFTFGIGAASSQYLVKGLARATGGMAEFIAYNEQIEEKVLRTVSRIASPAVTDVRIEWPGAEVDAAQSNPPPVFDGDALRIVGRFQGDAPETAVLRCRTKQGEQSWTVSLPDWSAETDVVALEWARQRLSELEETSPNDTSLKPEDRGRMVRLSKDFNLLCRLTSFIAIEHRSPEERNSGRPVLREVPVMLPAGWGGMDMASGPAKKKTGPRPAMRKIGNSRGGMQLQISQQMNMSQQLKLAPRMVQSMEILQLPLPALQERVDYELSENVLLEQLTPTNDAASANIESADSIKPDVDNAHDVETDFERLLELSNRESVDNMFDLFGEMGERAHDLMSNVDSRTQTLSEALLDQFAFFQCEEDVRDFGKFLICNLDQHGRLPGELAELVRQYRDAGNSISDARAEEALSLVQKLDPPGVGARSLQECLLLQVADDDPNRDALVTLITSYMDHLAHNRLRAIQRQSGLSMETIKAALATLKSLNPHPGGPPPMKSTGGILPDVAVELVEGSWTVRLCEDRIPFVRISQSYQQMLAESRDSKTSSFLQDKVTSAKSLIDAIEMRNTTLLAVARAIVDRQVAFLEHGPGHIVPLKMQDIADDLNIHVTTVSRAVDGKFVETPVGVLPLKRFFAAGTTTSDGKDVAWEHVRLKLKELVDGEDKGQPYSDDALVNELAKQGLKLARRTVTKYRKAMHIPSARQRRVY